MSSLGSTNVVILEQLQTTAETDSSHALVLQEGNADEEDTDQEGDEDEEDTNEEGDTDEKDTDQEGGVDEENMDQEGDADDEQDMWDTDMPA